MSHLPNSQRTMPDFLESVEMADRERSSAQSLIEEIRTRLDIESPLILTFCRSPDYNYQDDISLFRGTDFIPEGDFIPESDYKMPTPIDIRKVFRDLAEIQQMTKEAEGIEARTLKLREEKARLLPELLDKLLGDHPQKNILKEVLTPKL